MIVELINTGSELMLGRVLNTHQQWLCRKLADMGYVVSRQVAVPDTANDIEQAVQEALSTADLVIVTGGLGPTSDDLTRDRIARMLGKPLREDAAVLAHIEGFFTVRKRAIPEGTRVQAQVPEGAKVLTNPHGTAPGLAMEVSPNPFRTGGQPGWLILLPGPPRELRPMFTDSVAPMLKKVLPLETEYVCRTLRTTGLGESIAQARIASRLSEFVSRGLELGYCGRPGQVDIRLAANGPEAERMVHEAEEIVRAKLSSYIYGADEDELAGVIITLLTERNETLALAESCTGGLIAHELTNVPGASAALLAGLVTYSNEAKQRFLGVRAETLAEHGAVSEQVAREMAEGARRQIGATFGIAVTGIAGPTGGSADKPVGTVYIALSTPTKTTVERNLNPYDRETFKQVTAQQALEKLRRDLVAPVAT